MLGTVEVGVCIISSLSTSLWLIHVGLAIQVVIKAKRRCEHMVRMSCLLLIMLLLREYEIIFRLCQVSYCAHRIACLNDPGIYLGVKIRDAHHPVLDPGTI